MEARFSAPLGRFRDGLFLASDDHNRVLILNPQSGDILEKPLLGGETFSGENPQVSLNNRFVGYKVHAGKVASISVTNGETGLPAASDLKNLRISLWPMMVRPWLCPRSRGLWTHRRLQRANCRCCPCVLRRRIDCAEASASDGEGGASGVRFRDGGGSRRAGGVRGPGGRGASWSLFSVEGSGCREQPGQAIEVGDGSWRNYYSLDEG